MRSQKQFRGAIQAPSQVYRPGDAAAPQRFQVGDFILTHSAGLLARLIGLGQSVRYHGELAPYAWWTHAALIVSPDGGLIEAVGKGVQRSHLNDYHEAEYTIVSIDGWADARDREQIRDYAQNMLAKHRRYGLLTTISMGWTSFFGGGLYFALRGQCTCSGLVACALERSSLLFDNPASHLMPADLALLFEVPRPPDSAGRGRLSTPRQRAQGDAGGKASGD